MPQTHRICDVFKDLKVGMQVETCADCYEVSSRPIKGVIGIIEIEDDKFYIFTNSVPASYCDHQVEAQAQGWKCSWVVYGDCKQDITITDFLINTKGKFMTLMQKFQNLFLKEPEKSFKKAGIVDGNCFLTEEAKPIFLKWLLDKHAEEFKKDVVDPILKEMEKE